MKKLISKGITSGVLSLAFINSAFAASEDFGIGKAGEIKGTVKSDFATSIITFINYFLGFLGLLVVTMIIYAGVLFVTAQGDEQQLNKAKKIILWAAVGMIIVMLSFAIVRVIAGAGDVVA